jgi:hypothetical protein
MKTFASIVIWAGSLLSLSSCRRTTDDKLSMPIGMDEDYKIVAYYDGSGWGSMSKQFGTFTGLDGVTKVSFLANRGPWALMSTQHYAFRIVGTSKPLDTDWDHFAWDLQISCQEPLELVFSGFQNTNGFKTNEDGMVFDFTIGETNLEFTNQLVLVYDRETNGWHK